MSAKRRKIVAEDFDRGYGTTTIPTDSGGTRAATRFGIHSILGNFVSAEDFTTSSLVTTQLDNAITALGSNPGSVLIPATMGSGNPTTIPNNVAVWDFRDKGRLSIRTNPTAALTAGSSAALSIRVGTSAFSTANPTATAAVAFGAYIQTGHLAGTDATGINTLVQVDAINDSFAAGTEANVDNSGTETSSVYSGLAKFCFRAVPSNTKRITAMYSADSTPSGASAYYGLAVTHASDACIYMPGEYSATWKITAGITANVAAQSVATNYDTATQNGLHIGATISMDTGGSQEDVVITAITAGSPASITGIFTKNHSINAPIHAYASAIGIDFGQPVFASSAFRLGSIQSYNSSNTAGTLSMTVNDSAGTQRVFTRFTAANILVQREVGGGFWWEDKNGTLRMALTAAGNLGIATSTPTSPLHVAGLAAYATNALAIAGGLTAGAFYRTGADPDPVCVVH